MSVEDEKFERLDRKLVHKGHIIDFYEDTVKVPNGNVVKWDLIGHKGAAACVPVLKDGRILEHRTDIPKGSPGNPLTAEERFQKLLDCCPKGIAPQLANAVETLKSDTDLSSLIKILKTDE